MSFLQGGGGGATNGRGGGQVLLLGTLILTWGGASNAKRCHAFILGVHKKFREGGERVQTCFPFCNLPLHN